MYYIIYVDIAASGMRMRNNGAGAARGAQRAPPMINTSAMRLRSGSSIRMRSMTCTNLYRTRNDFNSLHTMQPADRREVAIAI